MRHSRFRPHEVMCLLVALALAVAGARFDHHGELPAGHDRAVAAMSASHAHEGETSHEHRAPAGDVGSPMHCGAPILCVSAASIVFGEDAGAVYEPLRPGRISGRVSALDPPPPRA